MKLSRRFSSVDLVFALVVLALVVAFFLVGQGTSSNLSTNILLSEVEPEETIDLNDYPYLLLEDGSIIDR